MKRYIFTLLATLAFCCASAQDKRPDTLWYQYDNRFVGNEVISIVGFDSITFNKTGMKRYRTNAETGKVSALTKLYPARFFLFPHATTSPRTLLHLFGSGFHQGEFTVLLPAFQGV